MFRKLTIIDTYQHLNTLTRQNILKVKEFLMTFFHEKNFFSMVDIFIRKFTKID